MANVDGYRIFSYVVTAIFLVLGIVDFTQGSINTGLRYTCIALIFQVGFIRNIWLKIILSIMLVIVLLIAFFRPIPS